MGLFGGKKIKVEGVDPEQVLEAKIKRIQAANKPWWGLNSQASHKAFIWKFFPRKKGETEDPMKIYRKSPPYRVQRK